MPFYTFQQQLNWNSSRTPPPPKTCCAHSRGSLRRLPGQYIEVQQLPNGIIVGKCTDSRLGLVNMPLAHTRPAPVQVWSMVYPLLYSQKVLGVRSGATLGRGWRSFFFQIKPLHHRIQASPLYREYAGAAGRRHSHEIGIAHLRALPPVPASSFHSLRSQAPALKVCPCLPFASPQNTGSIPSQPPDWRWP